jgi:2-oxoisovalerate dehydrogenase E2 component (dihydrolipoyl transacylase)
VAILGEGKIRPPSVLVTVGADTAVHRIMPLSLNFDHRAVSVGEASRFLGVATEDLQRNI